MDLLTELENQRAEAERQRQTKELEKLIDPEQFAMFEKLIGKPFWDWIYRDYSFAKKAILPFIFGGLFILVDSETWVQRWLIIATLIFMFVAMQIMANKKHQEKNALYRYQLYFVFRYLVYGEEYPSGYGGYLTQQKERMWRVLEVKGIEPKIKKPKSKSGCLWAPKIK